MSRSWDCGGRCSVALLAALLLAPSAFATDPVIQTRDYAVVVGGKPAGEVHMTIHRQEDGTTLMRCDTDVKVKVLAVEYKFIYRGLEKWKDNRLVRFDSNTDDNGKRYIVSAAPEGQGVRVTVNNKQEMVPAHVWLTSYWTLPDEKVRAQEIPILDADNGKLLMAKLSFVATEKVKVPAVNDIIPLNHYRLTGKVNMDLWYDGNQRLVRQEWVEQGHKTLVELVKVRQ